MSNTNSNEKPHQNGEVVATHKRQYPQRHEDVLSLAFCTTYRFSAPKYHAPESCVAVD
eukprot:JP447600.1.p6 GENE.JP447600.1~~JP447600.1.p6  ORF type:complete len:58 (-),score=5.97 JP447600.1:74-247(-)